MNIHAVKFIKNSKNPSSLKNTRYLLLRVKFDRKQIFLLHFFLITIMKRIHNLKLYVSNNL